MNTKQMSREEAIDFLKLGIDFGVSEVFSETPRDRLSEKKLKIIISEKNHDKQGELNVNFSSPNESQAVSDSFGYDDYIEFANGLAKECSSVIELERALNTFPHFITSEDIEIKEFYKGPENPLVLIFKEADVYGMQASEDQEKFNKAALLNNIVRSVENTLTSKIGNTCGLLKTFPRHFDISGENRAINAGLIYPFILRHITLLNPKAVIFMGGFKQIISYNNTSRNKQDFNNIAMVDFPSLDVLGRAPKRKKEIWREILALKKNLIWKIK